MEFHERLRYLIDCEEMKIKDLAAKLHLAPSTLGNYVQGTREPDYDTLRRIADYFGVSIDYLLGHETPAVDDERQLLTCYRSFTPSQKRFLLDQAALIKRYKIRLDRPAGCGGPVFCFLGESCGGVRAPRPANCDKVGCRAACPQAAGEVGGNEKPCGLPL